MEYLSNLINICNLFKQGNFEIEEFQSRISTSMIPDEASKEFTAELIKFDNQIETIIFSKGVIAGRKDANEAADKLIHATLTEQERLKKYSPYKLVQDEPTD